jgi:hypothetical protein
VPDSRYGCWIVSLQVEGTRRVLLAMPDMHSNLYPRYISRNPEAEKGGKPAKGDNAFMSSWDPRHLNLTHHPHAANAMVLAATLHPGDALHIPVSWWHYIEARVSDRGLSVGVNAFAYAHRDATERPGTGVTHFMRHPCDPESSRKPSGRGVIHAFASAAAAARSHWLALVGAAGGSEVAW